MEQKLPNYLQEFPNFGELDVKLPASFQDYSWHNDVCPSFAEEQKDGTLLRIWVDYADPAMREATGEPRFNLSHYTADDEWKRTIATSDDIQTILDEVEDFKRRLKSSPKP